MSHSVGKLWDIHIVDVARGDVLTYIIDNNLRYVESIVFFIKRIIDVVSVFSGDHVYDFIN